MTTLKASLLASPRRRWIPWWTGIGALLLTNAAAAVYVLFHASEYGRLDVVMIEQLFRTLGFPLPDPFEPTLLSEVVVEQLGTLMGCLVAGILAWKKPDRLEVRMLTVFLGLMGLLYGPAFLILAVVGANAGMDLLLPAGLALSIVAGTLFLRFTSLFPHRIVPEDLIAYYRGHRPPGEAAGIRVRPRRLRLLDALRRMRARPLHPVDAALLVLGLGAYLLLWGSAYVFLFLRQQDAATPEWEAQLMAVRDVGRGICGVALLVLGGGMLMQLASGARRAGPARRPARVGLAVLLLGGVLAAGASRVDILPFRAGAVLLVAVALAAGTAAGGADSRRRLPDRLLALVYAATHVVPVLQLVLLLPVIVVSAGRPLGKKPDDVGAPWLRAWMLWPGWLWARAALWIFLISASFVLLPDGLWLAPVFAASGLVMMWAIIGGVRNLRIGYALTGPADRAKAMWIVNGFALILWTMVLWLAVTPFSPALVPEEVLAMLESVMTGMILPLASLSVAMAVFYHGALDPDLVLRRTTVFGALGVAGVFLAAGLENLLQDGFARGLGLPPAAAPWIAGGMVTIVAGTLRAWLGKGTDRLLRRWLPPAGDGRVVVVSMDFAELDRYGESDAPGAARLSKLLHSSARRAATTHGGRLVERGRGRVLLEFAAAEPALAFVREVFAAVRAGSEPPGTADARLRAGVHAGEVIRDEEDALYGQTVAEAERLRERAAGGCVLVSPAVETEIGVGEREAAD